MSDALGPIVLHVVLFCGFPARLPSLVLRLFLRLPAKVAADVVGGVHGRVKVRAAVICRSRAVRNNVLLCCARSRTSKSQRPTGSIFVRSERTAHRASRGTNVDVPSSGSAAKTMCFPFLLCVFRRALLPPGAGGRTPASRRTSSSWSSSSSAPASSVEGSARRFASWVS